MKKQLAVVAGLGGAAASAQAAVPTGVEAMFTALGADAVTMMGYGWILFGIIVGGLTLFKIARKVFGKSS